MTKEKKISVSKEDMEEEWTAFEKAVLDFRELVNKLYGYSSWVTNVAIANLGFTLAVLLQLKSQKALFATHQIIVVLLALGIAIIIGFYLKIRYEVIDTYTSLKTQFQSLKRFLNKVSQKLREKGADVTDIEWKPELIKMPKIETMARKYPIRLLLFQFILVLSSIVQLSIYMINYLFFRK